MLLQQSPLQFRLPFIVIFFSYTTRSTFKQTLSPI